MLGKVLKNLLLLSNQSGVVRVGVLDVLVSQSLLYLAGSLLLHFQKAVVDTGPEGVLRGLATGDED